MNVFYTQIMVTQDCNQNCYYCDIKTKDCQTETELDIHYFKWIVDEMGKHTDNLMIEVSGGEPGLCTNLESALVFLDQHPKVKFVQLMSNGLVRYKRPDLLKLVQRYNEHLVYEIVGTTQHLFYGMDHVNTAGMLHPNAKSVIVTTPKTVNSLLDNFSYFRDLGLFDENMWIKPFVERTMQLNHHRDLVELYTMLADDYNVKILHGLQNATDMTFCSKFPFQPTIDLHSGMLYRCAYNGFNCNEGHIPTIVNIERLINNTLFIADTPPKECEDCYLYSREGSLRMKRKKANRTL